MDPKTRSMLKVTLPAAYEYRQPVADLGRTPDGQGPGAVAFSLLRSWRECGG